MGPQFGRFGTALLAAGAAVALLVAPASAQTTVNAEVGLQGYVRSMKWFPVRLTVTHQGQPARVEVRVRQQQGLEGVADYRVPEKELRSGANEVHTVYVHPSMIYGGEPLTIELYRDGRVINSLHPQVQAVSDTDWLVAGIGPNDSLKLLTTVTLPARKANAMMGGTGGPARVNVAVFEPGKVPDRWQGLQGAHLVVLGNVSERDLSPEQQSALREYVIAGGTLVVSGGPNWNRLTTPFFRDLLPMRVTGGSTLTSARGLAAFAHARAPGGGAFAICTGAAQPGSSVLATEGGSPLLLEGRKGSGRVYFATFDPSTPPFRNWDGVAEFWKRLLPVDARPKLVSSISTSDSNDQFANIGGINPGSRLADAPFAIPQLDIPAFYIVALFLLAYIVVLVPVNYFFLKAKDKKEYAWLTTPAIVAVFSVGAYLIGYGFKGGRTLVVRAGAIEAYAGQDAAPGIFYAGLFSPRKTDYDVQMAPDEAGQRTAASSLLSEPGGGKAGNVFRVSQDDVQKVEGYSVDMWAMRVLKSEGVVQLGRGFSGNPLVKNGTLTGSIRNDSPLALEDCRLVAGNQIYKVDDLAPGTQVNLSGKGQPAGNSGALPSMLLSDLSGGHDRERMKRAVLQPLCTGVLGAQGNWVLGDTPVLVGWVRGGAGDITVDGRAPRETAATVMLVHLGQGNS